jgi:farnesol dehydrogenase
VPGEAVDGDVRDRAALARAAVGCDAICHSAALVALWRRRRAEFDEINVGGLRHVLDAARAAGVGRLVYTSSFLARPATGEAEPGGWNDYQRTKAAADRLAAEAAASGAPVVRVYPGVIYGPGARTDGNLVGSMIADHLAGKLPGIDGADRTWSYAWIDEVARGHVAAAERGRPGACYALGGENAPQMRVFEIVRALTGRPLPRRLPLWAAVLAGTTLELRAALTGRPPRLTAGTARILARDWAMDSSTAIDELGYRIVPLEDGIARLVRQIESGRSGPNSAERGA